MNFIIDILICIILVPIMILVLLFVLVSVIALVVMCIPIAIIGFPIVLCWPGDSIEDKLNNRIKKWNEEADEWESKVKDNNTEE